MVEDRYTVSSEANIKLYHIGVRAKCFAETSDGVLGVCASRATVSDD